MQSHARCGCVIIQLKLFVAWVSIDWIRGTNNVSLSHFVNLNSNLALLYNEGHN